MTEAQARQLGRLFKQARRARKLSLRRADELSGVSYGWIGDLERGHMTAPAPSKLMKVAHVLGIPPERIDQITRGQVSSELPPIRTYFRAKYQLTSGEINQIEELFDQIRRSRHDINEELDQDASAGQE
jgi:transcriptional regulator with XRE-family HTH domain